MVAESEVVVGLKDGATGLSFAAEELLDELGQEFDIIKESLW